MSIMSYWLRPTYFDHRNIRRNRREIYDQIMNPHPDGDDGTKRRAEFELQVRAGVGIFNYEWILLVNGKAIDQGKTDFYPLARISGYFAKRKFRRQVKKLVRFSKRHDRRITLR